MMADDGRAFGALRPVPTRGIAAGGRVHTLRVGTRQNVVRVHGVAAAADNLTLFGQCRLLVDVGRGRMQIVHALAHHHALGILPRTLADAITRVDTRVAAWRGRAQIGAPVGTGRPCRLGERCAVRVRAVETAEIGAIALADTGDKERHAGLLGVHAGRQAKSRQRRSSQQPKSNPARHGILAAQLVVVSIMRGHTEVDPGRS